MLKELNVTGRERRRKPRIATPFPTRVRGVNAAGEAFEVESVLDNLSSDGLYLRLAHQVKEKAKLEFLIRMSGAEESQAPTVEARGVVLRAETKPGGIFGLAVKLTHHRFT
jgi:hypothetical protein